MKTQDARWTRIRDLFSQAVDLTPEQRNRFLDERCGDDSELRVELNALLDSDAGHSISPITGAIGSAIEATTREHRKELLGSIIGPYRLSSVIGHGGAGTVYLGERVDRQYSAKVAIKIVEGAALSAEIGRRFRAERQILANLNHPNIARLLDAGETEQGYPYLVMEYVHGEPIDVYCDKQKLGLEARIELLLKVCEAIRYAHQNLTVHRDIKPANILVLPDGTPKLLDFGIAKLLDTSALAADLALTRMNDRVLTPEYASPEQILGNNVTTATDVYSLGVVLYELLTGLRPYKVSAANQLELERTICVTDPTTPSAAVKQALKSVNSDPPPTRNIHAISEAREITPMRLRARLEGDLDAILLKSLRKELEYRYSTIDQFVTDLQSYLRKEPVNARQGNWVYYAQRFTRKHAFGVTVTAGFIVVLAVALVVTVNQARQIATERDNANREKQTSDAVASFMSDVFVASDPFLTQGKKEATARELLDGATEKIETGLTGEPSVKARLLETMGSTYVRQGQLERGSNLLEQSILIRRTFGNTESAQFARTLSKVGNAYLRLNDLKRADSSLREALKILESSGETESAEYAEALLRLAALEKQRMNFKSSFDLFEKTLALHRRIYGTNHSETAGVLSSYANAKSWAGDYAETEKLAREAVKTYGETKPELHPDRIAAESMLGVALLRLGRVDQAAPILEKAHQSRVRVFGDSSTRTLDSLRDLIDLRREQGDLVGAEALARQSIAISEKEFGAANAATAQSHEKLGVVLWQREKLQDAERELRQAVTIFRGALGSDSLFVSTSEYYLAEVLLSKGNVKDAFTQIAVTLDRLKRSGAAAWRIERSRNSLGQYFLDIGKPDEAKPYLEESYRVLAGTPGVSSETLQIANRRKKLLESLH